ncbi:MAG: hydantoinase B/oxoprolinase family protein [Methyloprofundus sp.]|uniref:hydantoinase B/oxoprolinase family protein n=1 Tax=Methyloprofundus sp. TaxID=2020875 RepID=UPI002616CB7E|nr:hydantoinase B/oxoprolinase family protein [Methyloprofundus sp.]
MNSSNRQWQFWVDRGGTFTDIVACKPNGQLISHKLLSDNPEQYLDAALQGIKELLKQDVSLSINEISTVKMGTTVGTNALLERQGEPTILLITQGFKDCLRIAYQNRPDIFALNIQLPEMLYQKVIEIEERLNVQGEVLTPLNKTLAEQQLQVLYQQGFRSIAIVLMHAWNYPTHEQQLAALAEKIGFTQISVSHQVSPFIKIVSRGDTTVVDAYLSPLLRRYVAQVSQGLQQYVQKSSNKPQLLFMQSNGGLTDANSFQGKDSILSGPAGGIVGAIATAEQAGFNKIIAFDMGGTSTDVAHYAGELERSFETEVAGVRMRVPMMNIHTVAAGGGSMLFFDGMRYRVGPDSAGANPGPASYRKGGPLTITDANLMLGKLPVFPTVFGEHANLSLDRAKVEQLFAELSVQIQGATGEQKSPQQIAEGFISIAIENMANAIKKISLRQGYNVAEYTLCCYGAAGGQHACKVADRLGMQRVMLHRFAGVLSAYGMGLADFRLLKDKALELPFDKLSYTQLQDLFAELQQQGKTDMYTQSPKQQSLQFVATVHLRYLGTDTALVVAFVDKPAMLSAFEQAYRKQFGFVYQDKPLIIESLSLEVIAKNATLEQPAHVQHKLQQKNAIAFMQTQMFSNNAYHETPVYQRSELAMGQVVKGTAIIIEATATTVIEPDWQAQVSEQGNLILTRLCPVKRQLAIGTSVDPVMLEIFNKLFMSIAEQMGFVLQNTAYSVNIKERLDFSCALFNAQGELIANAPHIPVHLGSMGESVLSLVNNQAIKIEPGDVYLLNSPYHGGTHLPDITVVTAVFDQQQLLFFVASRGHHADVGGISPGSMPANSLSITEEGLLSAGMKIVSKGEFLEQKVREWLTDSDYPARNVEQNIADLQAQIAANNKGQLELDKMVAHYSLATVLSYMQHVQNNAAESVRLILTTLENGSFETIMDSGAKIVVSIAIDQQQRTAIIDFSGTSAQLPGNFNAPAAVCKAAVLYVFRTLVKDDIPLNAGCLQPLKIIIPEHSMLSPEYPAAVVAGNVETSQYIVDCLYGALGVLASSQGTMNNLSFGNQDYQYYETICGGAGASADFDGCDAVHTHMTNSRITDPEILEWRFPVILDQFCIRKNSGGAGKHHGGNGVIRKITFLSPMTVSILSSHRLRPGFGLQGGLAGSTGQNTVQRFNGEVIKLAGCAEINIQSGDSLIIETPGGGGFGYMEKE